MLIMAMKLGLEHWLVRNDVAATGSSLVEKDPGTTRMSSCGAFSKEFWTEVSLCISMDVDVDGWIGFGASGDLFSLPDWLSDGCL